MRRDAARTARSEAEVARERGRERLRVAERAQAEAGFAERSARDRLADLERRRESLVLGMSQQRALLEQLTSERASIDWTPVEEALQRQLGARGEAEHALDRARTARDVRRRAACRRRGAARHRADARPGAAEDPGHAAQGAGRRARRGPVRRAARRGPGGPRRAAGSTEVLRHQVPAPGEIERLAKAIAELGAVNLAALEELSASQERKAYLDRQAADLTEAMSTLESAIRQIDRESRELLQQTFDVVNANFGKLFPALFGGGQARLVLTGEEILDSGVQVIAQPPGKRNTSIHLLSGGEKALAATSLVFALFQLNPAPFCLLDEVDAPLDDANTDRFCRMVREMSGETQFLFISHNKITMEMASQLIGITMPEPGISRVVAVDIAEAVGLAAAAAAGDGRRLNTVPFVVPASFVINRREPIIQRMARPAFADAPCGAAARAIGSR